MRGDNRVLIVALTESVATELAASLARHSDQVRVTPVVGEAAAFAALQDGNVDCVVATDEIATATETDFLATIHEQRPELPVVFVSRDHRDSLAARIKSIVGSSVGSESAATPYRDLFETMNEGMAVLELVTDASGDAIDYRILDVNRRYEEILEKGAAAVEGSLATDVYDVTEPPFLDRFERVVETGEPITFETEYHPLGSHIRVSAFRPEPGRFAVVLTDITEKTRAQRALEKQTATLEAEVDRRKAAETRYRSLFENNPIVIWEEDYTEAKTYVDEIAAEHPDVAGYLEDNPEEIAALFERVEIIDVNRKAIEYYDAESKAELIANLGELMTEASLDTNRRMWQAIANGQTHFRDETVSKTLTGRRRDEILEFRVPAAASDDYSRVYVSSIDITERRAQERELERLKERLELAVEGAQLGVWDWNMETDAVYRDGRWGEMLGYETAAITDDLQAFSTLLHPEDVGTHEAALADHVEGDADFYECRYRLRTADGAWKWIQNVGKIVEWGPDETPKRAVGIHQDVDEKRRTRERLEQNNDLLKTIDRVLRHNLHNDMNVIQGYAMTIKRMAEGELTDHAETIVETGETLLETVDKERRVVESLSAPLPRERVDIIPVIEAIVDRLTTEHPGADVRFEGPARLVVRAVETIDGAIEEVIENAIVHHGTAPTVEVEVETDGERAWIRVADRGPQIPEMERAVLTETNEITPLYHGSGFGLWLVNHVVNRSDGTLSFEKRQPCGNVVTIQLQTPGPVANPSALDEDSAGDN